MIATFIALQFLVIVILTILYFQEMRAQEATQEALDKTQRQLISTADNLAREKAAAEILEKKLKELQTPAPPARIAEPPKKIVSLAEAKQKIKEGKTRVRKKTRP